MAFHHDSGVRYLSNDLEAFFNPIADVVYGIGGTISLGNISVTAQIEGQSFIDAILYNSFNPKCRIYASFKLFRLL